ncbi:HNH endonuclease [Streptomyces violaceoruber]|uniref:HNH endonuclease n=1 Tax=Streptomyces violaceoruber TaxID=1935 RepID=A0ACD4WQF6_STRVN|nr:HNH endonuclease [Streptomyces violaceoruber]BDD72999.1 hypothetical protein JCM4020_36190 [Streptomyces coelicolor]
MMRVLMRQAPQDARDAWGPSAVLGVLSVLAGVLPVLGSVPTAADATPDAPLMRLDAPQVDTVRQSPTRLVRKHNPGQRARAGWRETRLYLAERDGRRCFYCRSQFDGLKGATIDHYIPKSVWACNLPANLVLACQRCNTRKNNRLTWSMAAVLLAHADRWEVAA